MAKRKASNGSNPVLETKTANVDAAFTRAWKGDGTITLSRELVRCGKAGCFRWHGPYWFAMRRVGGRLFRVYVGKTCDVGKARERLAAKIG